MRLPLSTADTGSPSALTKVRERIAHLRRFGQPQQEPNGIGVSSRFSARAAFS